MLITPICGNNKLQMGFSINGKNGEGTAHDGTILAPNRVDTPPIMPAREA